MSVRMAPGEREAFLERSFTGVLTTLRRDGSPVSLPMWFVVLDGDVHIRTRSSASKVARIARDGRACFVVEQGEAWVDLASVVIGGRLQRVTGAPAIEVEQMLNAKYAGRGVPDGVPMRTTEHYGDTSAYYRLVPDRRELTWDNSKLVRAPSS